MKTKLSTFSFSFNPESNGGEQILFINDIHSNGDPDGIYCLQSLSMQCYGNSSSFNMCDAFTPDNLRELADKLEQEMSKAKRSTK